MTGEVLKISELEYHNDPCDSPSLSSSMANILLGESPAHAYLAHPKLGGVARTPTRDMDLGSLMHALLLGKPEQVVIVDADSFRTNAAKEARDGAYKIGKVPVLKDKFTDAMHGADRLRHRIQKLGYDLSGGVNESTYVWTEDTSHGVIKARARLDHVNVDQNLIIDLKKTRSAHPDKCQKSIFQYGYYLQRAAYVRAVEKRHPELVGRLRYVLLFLETHPPYAVTPVHLGGVYREIGDEQWGNAAELWGQCLHNDRWPAYTEYPVELDAEPYMLKRLGLSETA